LVLKLKTIHSTTSYLLTYLHTPYFYVVDHTIFEQFQTGKFIPFSPRPSVFVVVL